MHIVAVFINQNIYGKVQLYIIYELKTKTIKYKVTLACVRKS